MPENQNFSETEKEIARKLIAQIPFVRLLGIELLDIEPGAAACRLQIEEKHLRAGEFLHGGATASLIDTTTAFAVGSLTGDSTNAVTVDLTVHYLLPIRREAVAKARVLRGGKRLLTVTCDVFDETGELAATALTTYSRINPAA